MPDYSSRTENQSIKGRDCGPSGVCRSIPDRSNATRCSVFKKKPTKLRFVRRGADANECEQTIKQEKPEHEAEKQEGKSNSVIASGAKQSRSSKHKTLDCRVASAPRNDELYTPFNSVEDAWFWFIQAQQARNDGANFIAGLGIPRPCEPLDFLNIMNRLYKNRFLTMDHFKVLRHYGLRGMAPDPERPKEARAWHLWREAFNRLEPVLIRRGIIRDTTGPSESWADQALVYESRKASFTFEDGEWV